ncbi:hypothetical protein NU688_20380 [Variovorax sp. ZS18.2.2]|uniref:hypothetical protein n=1 Tax=Variovorax sp. ZS18.2.2 TaxID=2971255 RepID=UPI0021509D2F|nr:hypothetical protein [Variovorax sp. ZS18.2.2]MCR6478525.1 hypothetical protein [Variovorax sp. ZS18.2.2]
MKKKKKKKNRHSPQGAVGRTIDAMHAASAAISCTMIFFGPALRVPAVSFGRQAIHPNETPAAMPPDPTSHAGGLAPGPHPSHDTDRRRARFALPQAFWIGLTLATPIAALAGWYFFGLDRFGAWSSDAWSRWLMLGSAAFVVLLHLVILAMLIAEARPVERPPQEPPP